MFDLRSHDAGPRGYSAPAEILDYGDISATPDSNGTEFDQVLANEAINIAGIEPARVVQALAKNAVTPIQAGQALRGETPTEFPKITLKHVRTKLKRFQDGIDPSEYANIELNEQSWPEIPNLFGFRPFGGEIPAETVRALDDSYGEQFTARCLRSLIEKRNERFANAGQAAGATAMRGKPGAETQAEGDKETDSPRLEYKWRGQDRQGWLYVGDIPFPAWYISLQNAAAHFIQYTRQDSGRTDLPDVEPADIDELDATYDSYEARGETFIIRSRTGTLPLFTSRDTDIDVALVNNALWKLGYPRERNFVADALYKLLKNAPRQLGPLADRKAKSIVPPPETTEHRRERIMAILESGQTRTNRGALNTTIGFARTSPAERISPVSHRSRGELRPRVVTWSQPQRAPTTPNFGGKPETDNDGLEHVENSAVTPHSTPLKPSAQTREAITQLKYDMNYTYSFLGWLQAIPRRAGLSVRYAAQRAFRR